MKTKKLFLIAAMLLASMCTFAQGESNEPLKGDVNGDGKVDVADITVIVAIIMNNTPQTTYYWYVGRQDYANGGIGTVDFETTNYSGFMNSSLKHSETSLDNVKSSLNGTINVGSSGSGQEDVVIIAPTSIINQITIIKNSSDSFRVSYDEMTEVNGYTTIYIMEYTGSTINIHF